MTIDYPRLKAYVFDTVIEALEENPRWEQRSAERDPSHDNELARLESQKAKLEEQARRARSLFVKGFMPDREVRQQVTRINTELKSTSGHIDSMLGTTVLSAAMADGPDWRSWTPSRRRNFIRLLVDQVVVDKWPEGMATGLPKRREESVEDHRARVDAHQREAIRKRVTIVTR